MNEATQIALFSTMGCFLWVGEAGSHQDAIRNLAADFAFQEASTILAIDVSDAQAEALTSWWDSAAHVDDYPDGLDTGVVYDAEAVAAITGLPVVDISDDWRF